MTSAGAEKAITVSALLVAGVYAYRRLTEGSAPATGSKTAQLLGQGSPPSIGTFITAWGLVYLFISVAASAAPSFGGSFAVLVAVGDILTNGSQVFADVNHKLKTGGTLTPAQAQSAAIAAQQHAAAGNTLTTTPPARLVHPPVITGPGRFAS